MEVGHGSPLWKLAGAKEGRRSSALAWRVASPHTIWDARAKAVPEACEFSQKSCDNGGDDTSQETCEGAGAVLVLSAGAVIDVANNRNDQAFALLLAETADTVKPGVASAHVDFGTSILTITFDEVVDLSPLSSKVNLANIFLTQVADGSANNLPQAVRLNSIEDSTFYNGTVVSYTHEERAHAQDGFTYVLHLSEPQRVAIMRIK